MADTRETMRVEVSGSDLAGDYVLDERLDDGSLVLRPEHPGEGQRYTAVLSRGEDGIVCAQVVEAPEAISQGLTPEEAKATSARHSSSRSSGVARRVRRCRSRPR